MNLDIFTPEEIKLLHAIIKEKIDFLDEDIKEMKVDIYKRKIYGESEVVNVILTDLETNEQIEETSEQLLDRLKGWLKEYEDLLNKIEPLVNIINESK